jgi:pimeloyl-ACP methyl ester carboxylesterase
MSSLFDSQIFNERLFFPRVEESPAPTGAMDLFTEVEGGRLHLRLHGPEDATLTLLLFGGNGEIASDYDSAASRFTKAGARLAVADYRGYGMSRGDATLRRAESDAERLWDLLRSHVTTPIVLMGRSLGSAVVAGIYAQNPPQLAGLVWESGFVDLFALIRRRGMSVPSELPESDLATFDARRKLARGSAPILILHGEEDEVIDPIEAQWAMDAAGATQKQLVRVAGRGHNNIATSPDYWVALSAFFQEL